MKKFLGLILMFSSFTVFADIHCSGGGITVDIYEDRSELVIAGEFNGTIKNLAGSGEEFMGSTSNGDFKSLTINVDDGEVDIIKKSGRPAGTIDVTCD